MTDYLQEYKEYYKVREERYVNNPNYLNTYQAEKNLSDAMQSCQELEEFKSKIGDLPDQCAFALMKDEYLMEQAHYAKHEEPFRKSVSDMVLEGLKSCSNVQDAITLASEANSEGAKAITADEYHRRFIDEWDQLDEIEIYANAEVPEKYKADFMQDAEKGKQRLIAWTKRTEEDYRMFIPDWVEKPETCLENRHRRLIPYKDEHIKEQLAKYKTIINR